MKIYLFKFDIFIDVLFILTINIFQLKFIIEKKIINALKTKHNDLKN